MAGSLPTTAMARQRFRPPPSPSSRLPLPLGLGLGLGLGVGALLVVMGLGLRAPVLLGAQAPPLAAGRFWWRRQGQLTSAALARGVLFEPWVFQGRLDQLRALVGRGAAAPPRWREISLELEAIRQLAARCAELDASASVSLLLLLEGLLDRLQPGADPQCPRPSALLRHLHLCRLHLAGLHDEALRLARHHPDQPIVFPPLPARFLP
ncbi:MAG: hypothetical protein ACK5QW_01890 [Cyanobacteriota bacterium]